MNTKETERMVNWGEMPSTTAEGLKEGLEGVAKPLEEGGCTEGSCCGIEGPMELPVDLGMDEFANGCKDCS